MSLSKQSLLRLKVRESFKVCSKTVYPSFYNLLQSKQGYLKAEELVIAYAIKNELPISTSIAQLESEL